MNTYTIDKAIRIAKTLDTPAETLLTLAGHEYWEVRSWVARNEHTSIDALRVLARTRALPPMRCGASSKTNTRICEDRPCPTPITCPQTARVPCQKRTPHVDKHRRDFP